MLVNHNSINLYQIIILNEISRALLVKKGQNSIHENKN